MTEQAPESHPEQHQFAIQRIYLKDVSFETPTAPEVFRSEWNPDNTLNLTTEARALDAQTYEVILTVTLTAKLVDKTAYLVEVKQAGIFTLAGFTDQEKAPMLGAYCPNVLFAYAREAVSDLIAKGSFPQMPLQPVNFDALFLQHQQDVVQRVQGAPAMLN